MWCPLHFIMKIKANFVFSPKKLCLAENGDNTPVIKDKFTYKKLLDWGKLGIGDSHILASGIYGRHLVVPFIVCACANVIAISEKEIRDGRIFIRAFWGLTELLIKLMEIWRQKICNLLYILVLCQSNNDSRTT